MSNELFNHTALTVHDVKDIENFYIKILDLEIKKENLISKELANQIFNLPISIKVITVGKNDLNLELFIDSNSENNNLNHLCINIKDRVSIIKKAEENNYPCIIVKRDPIDMVFIRDKSNNLFEIKQV